MAKNLTVTGARWVRDERVLKTKVEARLRQCGITSHYTAPPPRNSLSEENCIISQLLSTNTFYFTLTTLAEKIETDAIGFRLNQFTQPIAKFSILRFGQFALENAVLHPLSIRFQNLVDFGATFVVGDIVANHNIHNF